MDIKQFTEVLKDKQFTKYSKMKHKYGAVFDDVLQTLEELYYKPLPLLDFDGQPIVYLDGYAAVEQQTVKRLLRAQNGRYGVKAAEDEIVATSAIESIDLSRDSVRNILKGLAPKDELEARILGIKNGLEFIANGNNRITEENLYRLYQMTVGDFLAVEDALQEGCFYRHDTVYVVSDRVEHAGLDHKKVPQYMKALVEFANEDDDIHDLIKAAMLHFYMAFVHPYFDGNGRMARLLHLWFLIQKGYQSALFIPFSVRIEKSRKAYYDAYTTVEENRKISKRVDVTPFLVYMVRHVYTIPDEGVVATDTLAAYDAAVRDGKVTKKETRLWNFVLSHYGVEEFSTKQLERDFGDAAYATIRSFVLKFEGLGLLASVKYGTRVKYKAAE